MTEEEQAQDIKSTVRKYVMFTAHVATITEAFEFIMTRIDDMGDQPKISIQPAVLCGNPFDPSSESEKLFEVTLAGQFEEKRKTTEDVL